MEVNKYATKLKETNPDFTIALGNEIYLIDERYPGQKYFHFILIAKDAIGHKALRELSSAAWYNSYVDKGMERVPTTKEELAAVVKKYPGHLIATSACMGGELSTNAYGMSMAELAQDVDNARECYNNIISFIKFCLELFGDDFYIECAPSSAEDQKITNAKLYKIAKAYDIPMVIGTDAHYLTKQDKLIHKAYLNSKDGEREVDSFYDFAHLMDYDEAEELLALSFNNDKTVASKIINNTLDVQKKITYYSLERKQTIPKVEVKDYPKCSAWEWDMYPTIKELLTSDNVQERYWVNECILKLTEMGLDGNSEYAARLTEFR